MYAIRSYYGSFFFGLPTPAHTLFWTGIYWQFMDHGVGVLAADPGVGQGQQHALAEDQALGSYNFV